MYDDYVGAAWNNIRRDINAAIRNRVQEGLSPEGCTGIEWQFSEADDFPFLEDDVQFSLLQLQSAKYCIKHLVAFATCTAGSVGQRINAICYLTLLA